MIPNPPPPSSGFPYPLPRFPGESPDQSPLARSPFFNRRTGVLALVVCLFILLGGAVVYFDVIPIVTQGDAQTAVVRQFCADEVALDYTTAYRLLAPGYVRSASLGSNQFVQTLQQRDQRFSPVRACAIAGRDYAGTFASTAFFEVGFVFRVAVTLDGGSHTGNVTVVNDGGWKIRYLDAQLHLDG